MDDVDVLLIEDSGEYGQLLQRMAAQIEEPILTLRVEQSLHAGLASLRAKAPDVVLLDLTLGDSEGYETFAQTRRAAGAVPIVVLSGISDLELARRTVAEGAQDYLVKTHLNHHWLQRSLQYALERSQAQELLRRAYDELEDRVEERTAELTGVNARLEAEMIERRKVAEALRESNRQLAQAMERLHQAQQRVIQRERLQALGDMARGIVHDFNNKLAPILGFSEMLITKPELRRQEEKTSNYLQMIHEAATQAGEIVSRLQAFQGQARGSGDFAPVQLNDVIEEAIALVQVGEKKSGFPIPDVVLELDETLPEVTGAVHELRELFQRLLANAVEATRQKGEVSVRSVRVEDGLVIEVRDSGVGMSVDARRRCLEPFFSTKKESGAGFGLSIVYGAVRRHEAVIDIASELGKGTTVTIKFPLEELRTNQQNMEESTALEAKLKILVVEDEELVCEVLSVYLQDDGHEITTAENGREGLEKFRAGEFDIVLTDRSMPLMGGDLLALEIKKLNPAMPIILLTGFGDMMNVEGELPPGIDQVVGKPFTMATLRGALQKALVK